MVSKVNSLDIKMNGVQVGVLNKSTSGGLSFSYSDEWLSRPGTRPISLSLPLRHQAYEDERVFNYFDNLLPDNQQIRDRIQSRFKIPTSHPFDLLSAIGMDCVGAVQLVKHGEHANDVRKIEGTRLSKTQVSELLKNYRSLPLGMGEDDANDFRISIAGAQEKTALLWKDNAWCRPQGTTPTTHIFKLPIGKVEHSGMDLSESCENEWLCLKIAKSFGLPVCDSEVKMFNDTKALVVERFDRKWEGDWILRLPQEDMCQALGISPNIKYENDGGPGIESIMRLLSQSRTSKDDREVFFKTQILFWLLAAIDGHAKNFSVFIEPEGRFKMTPLYDIMSAHPLIANKQLQEKKIKMAMAVMGKNRHYHWHMIQPRHFISTAKQVGLNPKVAQELMSEMMDIVEEVIIHVELELPKGFPIDIAKSVFSGMRKQRDRYTGVSKLF